MYVQAYQEIRVCETFDYRDRLVLIGVHIHRLKLKTEENIHV